MTGRVIRILAGDYKVYNLEDKSLSFCKPTGKLKNLSDIIKVGDVVEYNNQTITSVYPRTTDLVRPNIANIEQAFIIFSVKEPDLNLNLLDKFLMSLEYHNIKPIIIFNKMDLLDEASLAYVNSIIDYYHMIGYEVVTTSAILNELSNLEKYLENHISVFTGQSGVGKSSLLNSLDDNLHLLTNEISMALGRGKHTTTCTELYQVMNGWIADTPGFGTIDYDVIDEVDIAHNFVEFFKVSSFCKYNGCLHINEPSCRVLEDVSKGKILKSRYENYLKFISDFRKENKSAYSAFNSKSKKRR